jgi:hypothetical protein
MSTIKLKDLKGEYEAVAHYETDCEILGIKMIAENADKIEKAVKIHLEKQGCDYFKREGNTLYFGNNQFFKLPLIPKKRVGSIKFRSKDYVFIFEGKESYGPKPKAADLTDKGFIIQTPQGHIEYILGNKIK